MRVTFTICVVLLFGILFLPLHATAPAGQAPEEPIIEKPVETPAPKPYRKAPGTPIDATAYKSMLRTIAEAKGLPEAKIAEIEGTIGGDGENPMCPNGESGWHPTAVGDGGDSLGMVQINLPSHPDVTPEQANDPHFALTFIVDEFLAGNEWKWTCWRALYGALPHSPTATTTVL